MARALPAGFASDISFAQHGAEALQHLREQHFDWMFLDLTMPVMDGYQTLEAILQENISINVIVVSGDIQEEAQTRTRALGALAFCQKPVAPDTLRAILDNHSETQIEQQAPVQQVSEPPKSLEPEESISPEECLREIANIAMGEAAANLAKLLKIFINLPIPKVAKMKGGDVPMTLASVSGDNMLAVSQGFVFQGIAGEAVLSTDLEGIASLHQLMIELEASSDAGGSAPLLDAATILIGAFLTSIGRIFDLSFSKSAPKMLSKEQLPLESGDNPWLNSETLAIEIPYHFEAQDIVCDLLLLFPGEAGEKTLERAALYSN